MNLPKDSIWDSGPELVALGEARFVVVIPTADTEVLCQGQGLTF